MTPWVCQGCGEEIPLTKASDLSQVVAHAKSCNAVVEAVIDLPPL